MELTNKEMYNVSGGGLSLAALAALASSVIFFIGTISGFTNPSKCNN